MDRICRSNTLRTIRHSSTTLYQTGNASPSLSLTTRRAFSVTSSSQNQNGSRSDAASPKTINKNNNTIKPKFTIKRTVTDAPRARVVDARSLGVSRAAAAAAAAAPDQANIIRAPVLRLKRGTFTPRGRGGSSSRPGAAAGPSGGRGKGGAATNNKSRGGANNSNNNKTNSTRRVRRKRTDDDDAETGRDADLEAIFNETKEASRPKTVRYTPVTYDPTALKDTWPSLPTGTTGSTGSVLERLNLMSRRYANGYISPQELAKRLFEGDRVLFSNDEEKKLAMQEVAKLAQDRADKLTQRKGDLVEPEDSSFVSINVEDRKALLGQIVRGNYENWKQGDVRHPVLDEVQRQLYNNETYRITGKQAGFMGKFQSLLASAAQRKRA